MAINQEFFDFVSEQLNEFGDTTSKKMFGGVGFFKEDLMFGMISKDVFRLKVDAENQGDYEAQGMEPLYMKNKKKGMPYWEVPSNVLEDKKELSIWAEKALEASKRAKKKK